MRVVIAHPVDPAALTEGGAVRYAWLVVKHQLEAGIPTTLLGVQLGQERFSAKGLRFLPVVRGTDDWYRYLISLLRKAPFLHFPEGAIIHAMRLDFLLPFVLFKARHPLVLTSDEPLYWLRLKYPFVYRFGGKALYHAVERYSLKRIDRVITDVKTRDYFVQRYPWAADKIRIYTAGVDLSRFLPQDKAQARAALGLPQGVPIVVFVGRIAHQKNLELLLGSFAEARKRLPEALLVLAGRGDPEYEESIKELAETVAPGHVRFLGEVEPDRVGTVINAGEVMVLTSHMEGSPTVVREALACGVPVVTTDAGDVRSIITNERLGRVVTAEPEAIADALVEVIRMVRAEPEAVQEACRQPAQASSHESLGETVIEVYRDILTRWRG